MDSVDQPVVDLQRQDGEIIVLQNPYPHPRRNQLLGKSTDVAPIRFLVRDQEDSPARHASLWELVNRLHDLEGFLEDGQDTMPFASSEQGFRTSIHFNIDWPGYPTWLSESSISSERCSTKADLCRIVLSACTHFVHAMASHSPNVRLGGIWTLGLIRDMKPGDNIFTAKDLHLVGLYQVDRNVFRIVLSVLRDHDARRQKNSIDLDALTHSFIHCKRVPTSLAEQLLA